MISFQHPLVSLVLALLVIARTVSSSTKPNGDPIDYLDETSVVLITGAAGFIGSELALALHRTYSPKRILCVDRMGDHPSTQEELALFEFQRQRAFHVLQTLGPKGRFYRVDFRPMIPEYFDIGEVPVLDHIFRENSDITHVVHLADPFPHSALQAVPREKDVPKAGMIEALLEQLLKLKQTGAFVPHFSYASSYEVYPFATESNINPLTETQTLSAPSSLRGASKLIDETLAKLYFDEHGIYSVGLRFFSVYGPWSVPGSPMFEMAERAVAGQLPASHPHWESIQDFVYIDDAIDAVMTAMQFRPEQPHPLVINVATGKGASLSDVATIMRTYFPNHVVEPIEDASMQPKTVAFGSTNRAEQVLGYRPRVSLQDGVVKLLAWHFDRAYPYGSNQSNRNPKIEFVANQGIVSCEPTDTECLKATPVFPCASECSHESQCTTSFYDEIVGWTQTLTSKCSTVLYTVAMDPLLETIPSAHVKLQSTSQSFLDGTCNLAFVSEMSPLVQSLQGARPLGGWMGGRSNLMKSGKWILIPVLQEAFPLDDYNILSLLPKLSPGLFFGPSVKRAIYVDPDILLDSIPKLLQEASMQPHHPGIECATAMLIGKGKSKNFFAQEQDDFVPKKQVLPSTKSLVQNSAYRMIRIAVSDKFLGDDFAPMLDSRWMVHTLQSDDSRLFRCDVLGEVVQWDVDTDRSALEFVLGLHDLWSRVIAEKPWWVDENVVTIPEGKGMRRRLQEQDQEEPESEANGGEQNENADTNEGEEGDNNDEENEEGQVADEAADTDEEEEEEDEAEGEQEQENADEDDEVETVTGGDSGDAEDEITGHAGFEIKGGDEDEEEDEREEPVADGQNEGPGEDQVDDEVAKEQNAVDGARAEPRREERDFSTYDTWMGILSASSVKYFVRIVPSSEVGVLSLEDYDRGRLATK